LVCLARIINLSYMSALHCIPVQEKTMQDLKQRLVAEAHQADLVEVWLDSIQDLRLAEIFFEEADIKTPFLFVNKVPAERGDFMGTPEEHAEILRELFERGAHYVDVAFETEPKHIKHILGAKQDYANLIISYHNFEETPELKELQKVVKQAVESGADIVKVATFVKERPENVVLFELTTWAAAQGIKVIVVGMGQEGRLSRIVCPLLGSEIYYAPLEHGTETAPGQITKAELTTIWEKMI
jgi:3-dehydroquinate dehydratase I